ncbi:unnamed protein product [Anisakis simplex]|uniref:Secreted protein n=1 Tax=Anisakis simplex TaxID=6269 RepID=A0A0M3K691_ANISI|nr:unnamed protein product [Anisakis simplex]
MTIEYLLLTYLLLDDLSTGFVPSTEEFRFLPFIGGWGGDRGALYSRPRVEELLSILEKFRSFFETSVLPYVDCYIRPLMLISDSYDIDRKLSG